MPPQTPHCFPHHLFVQEEALRLKQRVADMEAQLSTQLSTRASGSANTATAQQHSHGPGVLGRSFSSGRAGRHSLLAAAVVSASAVGPYPRPASVSGEAPATGPGAGSGGASSAPEQECVVGSAGSGGSAMANAADGSQASSVASTGSAGGTPLAAINLGLHGRLSRQHRGSESEGFGVHGGPHGGSCGLSSRQSSEAGTEITLAGFGPNGMGSASRLSLTGDLGPASEYGFGSGCYSALMESGSAVGNSPQSSRRSLPKVRSLGRSRNSSSRSLALAAARRASGAGSGAGPNSAGLLMTMASVSSGTYGTVGGGNSSGPGTARHSRASGAQRGLPPRTGSGAFSGASSSAADTRDSGSRGSRGSRASSSFANGSIGLGSGSLASTIGTPVVGLTGGVSSSLAGSSPRHANAGDSPGGSHSHHAHGGGHRVTFLLEGEVQAQLGRMDEEVNGTGRSPCSDLMLPEAQVSSGAAAAAAAAAAAVMPAAVVVGQSMATVSEAGSGRVGEGAGSRQTSGLPGSGSGSGQGRVGSGRTASSSVQGNTAPAQVSQPSCVSCVVQ